MSQWVKNHIIFLTSYTCKVCSHFRTSRTPQTSTSKTGTSPAHLSFLAFINESGWSLQIIPTEKEDVPENTDAFIFNLSLPISGVINRVAPWLPLCKVLRFLPNFLFLISCHYVACFLLHFIAIWGLITLLSHTLKFLVDHIPHNTVAICNLTSWNSVTIFAAAILRHFPHCSY